MDFVAESVCIESSDLLLGIFFFCLIVSEKLCLNCVLKDSRVFIYHKGRGVFSNKKSKARRGVKCKVSLGNHYTKSSSETFQVARG